MDSGLGETRNSTSPRAAEPELRLLIELRPRHEIFFENLRDKLLGREVQHVWTTSPPGKFWPDVFVPGGIAWNRMAESGILHVLVVLMLITFTHLFLTLEAQRNIKLRPQSSIRDFEISEYLPPINTGSPPAHKPRKGHPLLAKQKIISLPPRPDNFEQTILSPADVKLPTNVPLPNIVAWTPVPAPVADNLRSNLTVPQLPPNVIAPPVELRNLPNRSVSQDRNIIEASPDAQQLNSSRKLDVDTKVIGPAPDDAKLRTPREIIAVTPAVIEPPPDANVQRNLGAMNVGKLTPTVDAPKIEVVEQRALPHPLTGSAGARAAASPGAPPPPPQGTLANANPSGQLIALNLHPVNPTGPVMVPPGRRTGEFAAGPEGKPDAPGTPDIQAGKAGAGGSGTSTSGPGKGNNVPTGIVIGNAPGAPPPGSVIVAGTPQKSPNDAAKSVLMAAARPPRIGEVPPYKSSDTTSEAPKIEDKIFSGKKSYSMSLNMPNLSSAGGSWIIHFAQLDDDATKGEVTAPVAMTKVDPAYPAELMRDGVEGTVVLYAVIHKDGSVGEVRVLRGLQGRLDENARLALSRWRFRPGTKNGQAVDLEAVVQIPYKVGRLAF